MAIVCTRQVENNEDSYSTLRQNLNMMQFPFSSSRPLFNTDTEHVVYNCGLFSFQPHLFNISSRQRITAHETNEMNHSVFEKRLKEPAWSVQKFPLKQSRLYQV